MSYTIRLRRLKVITASWAMQPLHTVHLHPCEPGGRCAPEGVFAALKGKVSHPDSTTYGEGASQQPELNGQLLLSQKGFFSLVEETVCIAKQIY